MEASTGVYQCCTRTGKESDARNGGNMEPRPGLGSSQESGGALLWLEKEAWWLAFSARHMTAARVQGSKPT